MQLAISMSINDVKAASMTEALHVCKIQVNLFQGLPSALT